MHRPSTANAAGWGQPPFMLSPSAWVAAPSGVNCPMCLAEADICGVHSPAKYISGKNSTVAAAPAHRAVGASAPISSPIATMAAADSTTTKANPPRLARQRHAQAEPPHQQDADRRGEDDA